MTRGTAEPIGKAEGRADPQGCKRGRVWVSQWSVVIPCVCTTTEGSASDPGESERRLRSTKHKRSVRLFHSTQTVNLSHCVGLEDEDKRNNGKESGEGERVTHKAPLAFLWDLEKAIF